MPLVKPNELFRLAMSASIAVELIHQPDGYKRARDDLPREIREMASRWIRSASTADNATVRRPAQTALSSPGEAALAPYVSHLHEVAGPRELPLAQLRQRPAPVRRLV